jgi:hypothetical protein
MPMLQRWSYGGNAYAPLGEKAAVGLRASAAFDEPVAWSFPWERPYTRDEWAEQVSTSGFVNRLPPATLAGIVDGIRAAIEETFIVRYSTVGVSAHRGGS